MVINASQVELLEHLDGLRAAIGKTPLRMLNGRDGHRLLVKVESGNPSGSLKDRSALSIIYTEVAAGRVGPNTRLVASSSGNFAKAAALISRALDLRFIAVVDDATMRTTRAILKETASDVICCRNLKHRLAVVDDLRRAPDTVALDQYVSVAAVLAHEALGTELLDDPLELPATVFVAVSSGGTIAGVSRAIKRRRSDVRIVAVDIEGSVLFGGKPGPRLIPGMGASVRMPLIDDALKKKLIDDVITVRPTDALGARLELLRHGIHSGGSSGAVFWAMQQNKFDSLGILPDRGAEYAGQLVTTKETK